MWLIIFVKCKKYNYNYKNTTVIIDFYKFYGCYSSTMLTHLKKSNNPCTTYVPILYQSYVKVPMFFEDLLPNNEVKSVQKVTI